VTDTGSTLPAGVDPVLVDDPDDPRLMAYTGMTDELLRRRRESPGGDLAGLFICEGRLVTERALKAGLKPESVPRSDRPGQPSAGDRKRDRPHQSGGDDPLGGRPGNGRHASRSDLVRSSLPAGRPGLHGGRVLPPPCPDRHTSSRSGRDPGGRIQPGGARHRPGVDAPQPPGDHRPDGSGTGCGRTGTVTGRRWRRWTRWPTSPCGPASTPSTWPPPRPWQPMSWVAWIGPDPAPPPAGIAARYRALP
jgi:hypothetical protein